ncbi:ABC-2 type transport system ATP-binding protein [Nakamurella panacisegetis]|uniref:ABC-2 type transport system ATP-binding protein n=1 Tax=Nakamurella panacisegetis TaxID=1090615 RepID=A0A1H0RMF2_9ACTN|nr:ABC transporter ATP-binding protein [Nakamurella panacisegetis]SDP30529.1 ABC-2 type transport system ATP-binding protein [Nakamurella panacisegetis]
MIDAIVVRDLVKTYQDLRAVDSVSFSVRHGEFFGILGPNGAGKTTLLEIIEGLREPDSGQAQLLGHNSWPRNLAVLPRIGVQLQATSFFERLTAAEQLSTFAALYGLPSSRTADMLELVGMTESAGVRAEKLSGGQAQRLSIACALVHDPDVVFLDEPTAALDPQARRNLWDLLRAINDRGKTVVLTTHYMDEAESLCDRVAIMDRGRILRMGRPAVLVRQLNAPVRISVDTSALTPDKLALVPHVERAEQDGQWTVVTTWRPGPVLAALADVDALSGLQVRGATLEDVFLDLTGREYRA